MSHWDLWHYGLRKDKSVALTSTAKSFPLVYSRLSHLSSFENKSEKRWGRWGCDFHTQPDRCCNYTSQ